MCYQRSEEDIKIPVGMHSFSFDLRQVTERLVKTRCKLDGDLMGFSLAQY
jgi:hypothetical protein